MAGGFAVDRASLTETAQGINDTIGVLKGLGLDETAEVGRGFSALSLSGLQAGDADLAAVFGGFCDRWSWGVRSLVQDGDQFAQRLGLSAGIYADTEQYLTGVAKNVAVALAGDPHLTDEQAAQASWSQDAAEVTGAPTPGGGITFEQAGQQADRQWTQVGQDELKLPDEVRRFVADRTGGAG